MTFQRTSAQLFSGSNPCLIACVAISRPPRNVTSTRSSPTWLAPSPTGPLQLAAAIPLALRHRLDTTHSLLSLNLPPRTFLYPPFSPFNTHQQQQTTYLQDALTLRLSLASSSITSRPWSPSIIRLFSSLLLVILNHYYQVLSPDPGFHNSSRLSRRPKLTCGQTFFHLNRAQLSLPGLALPSVLS